jgi:signal transduction histidine kinase/ActR/RegA family two-component response regulator
VSLSLEQPLRRKLPLLISALVFGVVAAVSWLGYEQVERALLAAGEQQVANAAQQLGGLLHQSALSLRRATHLAATDSSTVSLLRQRRADARRVVERSWRSDMSRLPQVLSRSLWTPNGDLRLGLGPIDTARARALLRPPVDGMSGGLAAEIGPLYDRNGSIVYDVVALAIAGKDTLGYLVETRQLGSGQSLQRIQDLIGAGSGRLLIGNRDGRLWTDGSTVVEPPPRLSRFDTAFLYERAGVSEIGASDAIPSTPWIVTIELPRSAVTARARHFLLDASVIAILLVAVGAIAAWVLSRSITRPLDEISRAAQQIAAGDYSSRVDVSSHAELASLAAAFNTMAAQVEAASRSQAQQALDARAAADQLEVTNRELERALTDAQLARQEAERAVQAHENTQTQLQQAQRMEAVGQLAGGIAHDFNNLLTVITSYSAMLMADMPRESPHADDVQEIMNAANRAASLTRQLLAFSRRQVLQPTVLDLNALTGNLEKMLRRLLREDIQLATRFDPHLALVNADAGQLEQVIVNLVVNARDAMPRGGQLSLETANVMLGPGYGPTHADAPPGAYVLLAITDTGVGMSKATQTRIFEPFFTTKPAGQGTGLGLSTVYGIVKQSGGYVWVYSEIGRGTTFKIYLPAVSSAATEPRVEEERESPAAVAVVPERILLVEDEPNVRRIARRILERNGYTVLEAANGHEALHVLEHRREPIALVLTDLVMPEMGGRELARKMRVVSPMSRVVFMSGYTEDAVLRQSVMEPGSIFLDKPFTFDTLLRKVREALNAA